MQTYQKITIAIDGYSSCGKSTLAKALAQKLDYIFIDSGAMYRCVALFALENDLLINGLPNEKELIKHLDQIQISFGEQNEKGNRPIILNGKDVSEEIRELKVANIVSEVATIEAVRVFLVKQQQALGEQGGVVMDGRDIGTVVFPNAALKLFITADTDTRAMRRFLELQAKGEQNSISEIKANLSHRDHLDTTRKISPLKQADDAIVIDNSKLNQQEQLELALEFVRKKLVQHEL